MKLYLIPVSIGAFLAALPWFIEWALAALFPHFEQSAFAGPFVMYRFFTGNCMGLLFPLCAFVIAGIVFATVTRRMSIPVALLCLFLCSPLLCLSYYFVFRYRWT
jgi:hypothetical protein